MGDSLKFLVIEKVRDVPAIWNKNHSQHHNRYVLNKQWKKIAAESGSPEDDAKRIWRNLRQEFGKQLKRTLKSGAADMADPQWPYYQSLLFLKEQFTTTFRSSDNNVMSLDESDAAYDEFQEDEFDDETGSVSNPTPSPTPRSSSRSPAIWNRPLTRPSSKGFRRRNHAPSSSSGFVQMEMEQPFEMRQQHQHLNSSVVNEGDEDVGFFNSLLPHVRQLQPQQKMIFRMRMQQQLYELLWGPTPTELYQSAQNAMDANHEETIH